MEWTKESLEKAGYKIENVKITGADLSMADHGVLCLAMPLEWGGCACVYGGIVLGHGYLGATEFEGSAKGTEYIMRIMDIVGVERFNQLKGKYARVATKGFGSSVKIIGNIIDDKWFDPEDFFKTE